MNNMTQRGKEIQIHLDELTEEWIAGFRGIN